MLRAIYEFLGEDTLPIDEVPSDLAEPPMERLGQRELEVLRLVAGGMSNQDVASELVIGVGTVKTHLNSIYGKLDANSRTRAAARARELNLL